VKHLLRIAIEETIAYAEQLEQLHRMIGKHLLPSLLLAVLILDQPDTRDRFLDLSLSFLPLLLSLAEKLDESTKRFQPLISNSASEYLQHALHLLQTVAHVAGYERSISSYD